MFNPNSRFSRLMNSLTHSPCHSYVLFKTSRSLKKHQRVVSLYHFPTDGVSRTHSSRWAIPQRQCHLFLAQLTEFLARASFSCGIHDDPSFTHKTRPTIIPIFNSKKSVSKKRRAAKRQIWKWKKIIREIFKSFVKLSQEFFIPVFPRERRWRDARQTHLSMSECVTKKSTGKRNGNLGERRKLGTWEVWKGKKEKTWDSYDKLSRSTWNSCTANENAQDILNPKKRWFNKI